MFDVYTPAPERASILLDLFYDRDTGQPACPPGSEREALALDAIDTARDSEDAPGARVAAGSRLLGGTSAGRRAWVRSRGL